MLLGSSVNTPIDHNVFHKQIFACACCEVLRVLCERRLTTLAQAASYMSAWPLTQRKQLSTSLSDIPTHTRSSSRALKLRHDAIYQFITCLPVCPSVCLSLCLFFLSCVSFCLPVSLCLCMSVSLSVFVCISPNPYSHVYLSFPLTHFLSFCLYLSSFPSSL